MSDVPYRFDRTDEAASLQTRFAELGAGEETGLSTSVAGRLMLSRPQGKLTFAELRDSSGAIQLFAGSAFTARYDEFSRLSLGDWVGATGEVVRTRRGELSVKLREWVLLAKARRGFGDKWRGITDPAVRYRQRYVDLWANEPSRRVFALRSRTVSRIRAILEMHGFVEAPTPVLQLAHGGHKARLSYTRHKTLDMDLYLPIASQSYLKPQLAAASDAL